MNIFAKTYFSTLSHNWVSKDRPSTNEEDNRPKTAPWPSPTWTLTTTNVLLLAAKPTYASHLLDYFTHRSLQSLKPSSSRIFWHNCIWEPNHIWNLNYYITKWLQKQSHSFHFIAFSDHCILIQPKSQMMSSFYFSLIYCDFVLRERLKP